MRFGRPRQRVEVAGEEPHLVAQQAQLIGVPGGGPPTASAAPSERQGSGGLARGVLRTSSGPSPTRVSSGGGGGSTSSGTPPGQPGAPAPPKRVAFSDSLERGAPPGAEAAAAAAMAAAEGRRVVADLNATSRAARSRAADALRAACQQSPSVGAAALEAGAVPLLAKLLSEPESLEGTGEPAAAAARAFTAMAPIPGVAAAANAAEVPKALVAALQVQSPGVVGSLSGGAVRADVADAIAALARRSTACAAACAGAGAIGSLMNMLFRGTQDDKAAAAAALARLADGSQQLQDDILDSGAAEPLLALLRDARGASLGGRSAAVLAIASLSKGRAVHGTRLGSAVPFVVALLREADAQPPAAAAGSAARAAPAQGQGATPAQDAAAAGQHHGGVAAPVSSVRERAILALSRLVVGSTDAKQAAMRAGAVPLLISILHGKSSKSELKASSAKCLANLAAGTLDAAAASAAAAEAMPALVHVLRTGNPASRDGAAAALANFVAAGGEGAAKSAIAANVLPSLAEVLTREAATPPPAAAAGAKSSTPPAQPSSVIAACRNLCGCGPDACKAVHAAGVTPHLVALMRAHKLGTPTQEGATRAFGALCAGCPDACLLAVNDGIVPLLVAAISSEASQPAARDAACAALGAAARCGDAASQAAVRLQATQAGVISSLVSRLIDGMAPEGRPASAAAAASCLAPLVSGDRHLSLTAARFGAITPLVALLNAADGRALRPHAEAALKALALNGGPGVRELIAREQCVGPLLALLDDLSDFGPDGSASMALAPLPDKQLLDAVIGTESLVAEVGPLAFFDNIVLLMSRPTDALMSLGPGLMDILNQLSPFKPFGGPRLQDGSAADKAAPPKETALAPEVATPQPPARDSAPPPLTEPPATPPAPSPGDGGLFKLPGLVLPDVGAFFSLLWQQATPGQATPAASTPMAATPAPVVTKGEPSTGIPNGAPAAHESVSPVEGGATSRSLNRSGSASSSSFASLVNALGGGEADDIVDGVQRSSPSAANGATTTYTTATRTIQF